MTLAFKKASKTQGRLRLALVGPSGSGKTYTALRIAKGLGKRIAVIDSERRSASKYAGDVADFDVLELEDFAPGNYVDAIRLAEREGYDVIVIDSLSHAWAGKGGALEMVDNAVRRSRSGNSFAAWREVTPEHNALVDALVSSSAHVITTMRAKTEWVTETVNGKTTPRKIGTAPIQRDGLEYEFDVVADLDWEHNLVVTKTRCAVLDKAVVREAGEEVADILLRWLSDGAPLEKLQETARPVDKVVAALAEVRSAEDMEKARKLTESHWKQLSAAERKRVKEAADGAQARVAQERSAEQPNDAQTNEENQAA